MVNKRGRKKKKTHVPYRLNILFFIVFILFSALILRLGFVQIVHGEDYRRELERTEDITVSNTVPRGKMVDTNYKPIVDNTPVESIIFTRYQGTKQEEMLETAEKLASIIEMDTKKITERDKKDFWILKNPEKAENKITKKDKKELEEHENASKELYSRQLERITKKELDTISEDDLQVLAIYREMASAKSLTPQIIKNKDVTSEEVAIISENLENLPGIDVMTDWDRKFLYNKTLRSIIGNVSSSEKGLPLDKLDYFQSRGYSNNDRVGTSYLEQQYEEVLHGQKGKVKNITDKSGNVLESIPITEGQRGKDLVLSIDVDLQIATEEVIESYMRKYMGRSSTYLMDRAFVVAMDPNTGDVLTMAGKQYTEGAFQDYALGNIVSAYSMGSAVKGATVLAGLETGVNSPYTVINDTRMYFKGDTKGKGSYKNLGPLNAVTALKKSSNVFMFQTAIRIADGKYVPRGTLNIKQQKGFDTLRYYYNQFGLGVRTGIDLPNELTGVKGSTTGNPGLLLDLSIGQYDMYTPMQLAQYVSTIANGGNRLQPRLVREIREPSEDSLEMGPLVKEMTPKVLNRVDMEENHIELVQRGFRQVMLSGGTGSMITSGSQGVREYEPAGKTGTAEAFYDGPKRQYQNAPTMNSTLVAYAPYDNPEIAISVVVPWAYKRGQDHDMSKEIGRDVLKKYFELKENRKETEKKEAE